VLEQVVKSRQGRSHHPLIQKLYLEPIKEELIARRVEELKKGGRARRREFDSAKGGNGFSAIAQEAGADLFVVQSTVSTVRHLSTEYKVPGTGLHLQKSLAIPVIIRQRGHLQCDPWN